MQNGPRFLIRRPYHSVNHAENQLLSVIDSRAGVHFESIAERFGFAVYIRNKLVGPFLIKTEFNIIRYIRNVVNCFPGPDHIIVMY